jgi:peptidoglycan/LPS O-acetylase OafA/YrhL
MERIAIRGHLAELDGLRAIAVLLVFFYHTPFGSGAGIQKYLASFFHSGYTGVDLFFVLSGFLITGILVDAKGTPNYFKTFYMRRTLRIFPLYYFVLAILLVALLAAKYGFAHHVSAYTMTFVNDGLNSQKWLWPYLANAEFAIFGPGALQPCFVHFWSLSVEEQFYLMWPLLVWRFGTKSLTRIAFGMIAGAIVIRTIFWHFGAIDAAFSVTFSRMDALAIGALIALWMRTNPLQKTARYAGVALIIPAAVFLGYVFAAYGQLDFRIPSLTVPMLSAPALFYAGVLLMILGSPTKAWVGLFRLRPLRFLGTISYGFYVYHGIIRRIIEKPTKSLMEHHQAMRLPLGLAIVVTSFAGTTLIAWLSWTLFEKRVLRLKSRFEYAEKSPKNVATVAVTAG